MRSPRPNDTDLNLIKDTYETVYRLGTPFVDIWSIHCEALSDERQDNNSTPEGYAALCNLINELDERLSF